MNQSATKSREGSVPVLKNLKPSVFRDLKKKRERERF